MKASESLLILFLTISFLTSNAQENKKLDSLLQLYNTASENADKLSILQELYDSQVRTNLEMSLKYAQEEIVLATKLNDNYYLFLGNFNLGQSYYLLEKRDTARIFLDKAISYRQNNKALKNNILINSVMAQTYYYLVEDNKSLTLLDKNLKLQDSLNTNSANTYGNDLLLKARIYQIQDNVEKQLDYALKALKVFESNENHLKQADALSIIAGTDTRVGEIKKGLDHHLQALEIYKKFNDKKRAMVTLNRIGSLYVPLGNRSLSKKYFEEVLLSAKEQNLPDWEAIAYDRLGGLEVEAGNYDTGIEFLEKGVAILRKNKSKFTLGLALLNLGNAYYDKKNYNKAIQILDECLSISEKNHIIYRSHKFRSASYEELNNFEQALQDYKKFTAVRDSVWNIDKSKQIEELRAIYDTEKKEQQIVLQESEIKLLEQKEKVSKLQKSLLGSGLLLALGLFGLGFYGFKQRIKHNKLAKEKVDAELDFKKKELTTHALHLAKKNEVLESLKQKAEELKKSETSQNGYQQLIRTINFDLKDDNNWENFSKYFQEVHKDFNSTIKQKFPDVTSNELRLMSLLKMNLSSKEIANILNISPEGIKKARYRLRKKLNITTEDSLQDLILNF